MWFSHCAVAGEVWGCPWSSIIDTKNRLPSLGLHDNCNRPLFQVATRAADPGWNLDVPCLGSEKSINSDRQLLYVVVVEVRKMKRTKPRTPAKTQRTLVGSSQYRFSIKPFRLLRHILQNLRYRTSVTSKKWQMLGMETQRQYQSL